MNNRARDGEYRKEYERVRAAELHWPSHHHRLGEQCTELERCLHLSVHSLLSLSSRQTSTPLWNRDLIFLRAFALENLAL